MRASYLYASPNFIRLTKSRRTRWAGHLARMEGVRNARKCSVEKPEGKKSLGRYKHRW
jgi:hypothetical protein